MFLPALKLHSRLRSMSGKSRDVAAREYTGSTSTANRRLVSTCLEAIQSMASVFRRTDGGDHENDVSGDVESGVSEVKITQQPTVSTDSILEEPASKIWIPYINLSDKYDRDLVHNWRDDMDSLLIFAALFSASVTAFVIESYNNLVQDTGEVTISVLLQISQQIANGTHAAAAVRPSFQPASIDVAVNVLWFLSLAFSLTCALAAVLVRQWARQYLRFPRSFSSTSEQARARQFVFENMEWWKMDVVVEAIPVLLHISLILFFVGLLLFVRAVNFTLAVYLLCFTAIGGAAYTMLTITPLVSRTCPYKTPFTGFVGLCARGTALFRTIWKFTVVFLACLEVFVLCPFFRLWMPSFERRKAMELSQAVRSTLLRFRKRLHYIVSHRRHCHSFFTSQWTSAIYSLQRASKYLSGAFLEHRQTFQDGLTIRDAHALQWTLEYSKRDSELFTIVSNAPAFVQYYESSPKVCKIMWQTGVVSHAIRLLRSCVTDGGPIQSVLVSCLENIICLAPCSTQSIKGDNYTLEFGSLSVSGLLRELVLVSHLSQKNLTPVLFGAVSNLVLRQLYALEMSFRHADDEGFWQQYHAQQSSMLVFIVDLQHWIWNADSSAAFQPVGIQLRKLRSLFTTEPNSPEELYTELERFRSTWVTIWLNSALSLPPWPYHGPLMNNLCDGATHLLKFPHVTQDSQRAVFMLSVRFFRTLEHKGAGTLLPKLHSITLSNSIVLLGQPKRSSFRSHYDMLSYFIEHVHVFGSEGYQFPTSFGTVEIPFHVYTRILHDLVVTVMRGRFDMMRIGQHRDFLLDATAVAIQNLISCRINNYNSCVKVNHFFIDAQHLMVIRAAFKCGMIFVSSWLKDWGYLVERTAKEFGYSFQLVDSYNIDIHAELLYYDMGAEPLRIEDAISLTVEAR